MKCKYRFKVNGQFQLETVPRLHLSRWAYDFVIEDGVLAFVEVTVKLEGPNQHPCVRESQTQGVKAQINANTIHFPFIQDEIKTLQGQLACFGLESIDWRYPEVNWLPENDEEKRVLPFYSMKVKNEPLPLDENDKVPLDLVIRSVFACQNAAIDQVPLNFFRRAMKDVSRCDYVDAIYDFYFVLEYLFAEGKFKSRTVKDLFTSSPDLIQGVKEMIDNPPPPLHPQSRLGMDYSKKYGGKSPEEILESLVDLRGRLHHSARKNKTRGWHPEGQAEFELDAMVIQAVSQKVVLDIALSHLYTPEILEQYEQLRREISPDA